MVSEKEAEVESMKMPSYQQEMQSMAIEDANSKLIMMQEKFAKMEE